MNIPYLLAVLVLLAEIYFLENFCPVTFGEMTIIIAWTILYGALYAASEMKIRKDLK